MGLNLVRWDGVLVRDGRTSCSDERILEGLIVGLRGGGRCDWVLLKDLMDRFGGLWNVIGRDRRYLYVGYERLSRYWTGLSC